MDQRHRILFYLFALLLLSPGGASAQSAVTEAASGVTDITATLRGTVTSPSTTQYRYVRFEYGTTPDYGTVINADQYQVIGPAPVAVTAAPAGLLPGTTYHYRVILTPSFSGGGWVGGDLTFTTGPAATQPSFQSAQASIVGDTLVNFLIWGTKSGSSPTTTTFEYGPTTAYGSQVTMPATLATNTTSASDQINATGLIPGTTYHFRVKLTNAQGTTYGADQTFATTLPATVTTGVASSVTSFSAALAGTATPLAHTLGMQFEYGTTASYGTVVSATPSPVSGAGTHTVGVTLTGLLPGTTYHYRLRGADYWNGGGYYDGEDLTFVTPTNVTTLAATSVTDLAAVANGMVDTGAGGTVALDFEYGTTSDYGLSKYATLVQSDTQNPNLKNASVSLTQLTPNTTYHYRFRSRSIANNHTTIGGDMSFTTGPAATPPVLGTPAAILSPRHTTASTITVAVQAGSSATSVVFDYGLDTSYGSVASAAASFPMNSVEIAAASLTALTPNTTYHFRARATNTEGNVTSADATFTTLPLPDVTTGVASNVGAASAVLNGSYHMRTGNYTVSFEYGPTTAYGFSTSPSGGLILGGGGGGLIIGGGGVIIGGGNNSTQNVAATLSGLTMSSTYHYRLKLVDSLGNAYHGADMTFSTGVPLESWRLEHFGTTANTGDAADDATPAGDGMPNLLKYALWMNPEQSGVQPPVTLIEHEGARYLSMTFPRNPHAIDLTYEVQVAGSLSGPWSVVASIAPGNFMAVGEGLVSELVTSVSGGLGAPTTTISQRVTVRDTVSVSASSQRFMRLKVIR